MIAFIFAMEKEAKPLLDISKEIKNEKHGAALFSLRKYQNKKFLLVISGIGKTLSGAAVAVIPLLYKEVNVLISLGLSASLNSDKYPSLTTIVPEKFVNYDIDTTPFGDPLGAFFDPPIVYFEANQKLRNLILTANPHSIPSFIECSGDKFIASKLDKDFLKNSFNAESIDMETGSEAAIAYNLKLPFAAIRVISDSGEGTDCYEENVKKGSELLAKSATKILENY